MQSEGVKVIVAGCDTDERVKVWELRAGELHDVRLKDWLAVLDEHGAKPGEVLRVSLSRIPRDHPATLTECEDDDA